MLLNRNNFQFCKYAIRRLSTKLPSFKVLDGSIDSQSSEFRTSVEKSNRIHLCLKSVQDMALAGGSEKAIKKHVNVKKKLLIRHRLQKLFDPESPFLEIGLLAGLGMDYGNISAAGLVVAIGQIHGHYCLAGGSDATVKGGTFFPIGVEKNIRSQKICSINRIPGVILIDSGGAFLPLQSEVFPDRDHGGRTFRNEAVGSAKGIPQIAIVCGSSTAGGAYAPTMAEEAIIVDRIGTIFLGGPPLVKAATGEVVTEEELGGADLHCRVSGCTDYFAETEDEAIEMCRESILTFNLEKFAPPPEYLEPVYSAAELNGIAGKNIIGKSDMFAIISRIVDGSGFKEFKSKFGSHLITGFAFLKGYLIGLLANSGPITSADAQKGAHFIHLCQKRLIPMIFLQNSGIPEKLDYNLQGNILKDRAKMIAAHSCANVPKITINVGGCHSDENFTMCGWTFKPNFLFSWPLAETQFDEKLEQGGFDIARADEDSLLLQMFENKGSALYRSSRMLQDGIILPEDTRKTLGLCLDIIHSGISAKERWETKNLPIFRM
ncbi:methylcrotonoyl-CoA carboxylase beta chain, mitochondrial-like isoform X2 [Centruroides sculpturatus]|uniref:methylcrotonoyl-CoA carboxylase beta chain, mitochondrial-like isoform X2 n=2 Tax=Centruroides sculpturatus TaxID=218467 RepID=UPI000C6D493B|nr:methylcrotonoyl-CoA carboxylase beta chain, mitochondrial-like isoform X2 [Centruroides sculpturatus]